MACGIVIAICENTRPRWQPELSSVSAESQSSSSPLCRYAAYCCRIASARRTSLSHCACAQAEAEHRHLLFPKSCSRLPQVSNLTIIIRVRYRQDSETVGPSDTVPGIVLADRSSELTRADPTPFASKHQGVRSYRKAKPADVGCQECNGIDG